MHQLIGILSHIFTRLCNIPGGCLVFFPSTESMVMKLKHLLRREEHVKTEQCCLVRSQ